MADAPRERPEARPPHAKKPHRERVANSLAMLSARVRSKTWREKRERIGKARAARRERQRQRQQQPATPTPEKP